MPDFENDSHVNADPKEEIVSVGILPSLTCAQDRKVFDMTESGAPPK